MAGLSSRVLDSGFIRLNSAIRRRRSSTVYPAEADVMPTIQWDEARSLLFSADEDFCRPGSGIEKAWATCAYDFADPAYPVQIGCSRPERVGSTACRRRLPLHNNFIVGTDAYMWYTTASGRRCQRSDQPGRGRPSGAGWPESRHSQRGVPSNQTQVWVVVDEATGLIYASDMNTGSASPPTDDRGRPGSPGPTRPRGQLRLPLTGLGEVAEQVVTRLASEGQEVVGGADDGQPRVGDVRCIPAACSTVTPSRRR
jgi:hypothetical protein